LATVTVTTTPVTLDAGGGEGSLGVQNTGSVDVQVASQILRPGQYRLLDGSSAIRAVTRSGSTTLEVTKASGRASGLTGSYQRLSLQPWAYSSQNNDFRQIPVVMFHNFANTGTATGVLKDYLAWGYQPIFYSEMMSYLATGDASGLPAKPIVFTDDDGGASSYYLWQSCQTLGNVKVTYFIVPDWLDGTISTPPNGGAFMEATALTWVQANEMQASGFAEFQSHTKTHGSMRALTGAGTFTPGLTADGSGAGADFLYCKQRIETMIPGSSVWYNAAPYGVINETAIASLKAAGCRGNRVTQTGLGLDSVYDGSGPSAFTYPWTDPFRVPIADGGNFKYIRRQNVYGVADVDGNQVENGRFTQTQRGWTLPTANWTFAAAQTLPTNASPSTGPVLQGVNTDAATGAYHTAMIPVGFYAAYTVDYWLNCTSAPATSARLALDFFANPADTVPVSTFTDTAIGGTTAWTRKRAYLLGDATYAWVRPRFEVVGATASTKIQAWDVKLRRTRSAWGI
jgi:Polysaccharide deacetylase